MSVFFYLSTHFCKIFVIHIANRNRRATYPQLLKNKTKKKPRKFSKKTLTRLAGWLVYTIFVANRGTMRQTYPQPRDFEKIGYPQEGKYGNNNRRHTKIYRIRWVN